MSIQHEDADQIHKFAYISAVDPGAVGAHKAWLRTTTLPARLLTRNALDTAWNDLFLDDDAWDTLGVLTALTPSDGDVLQYDTGNWTNITIAALKTSLALNNVPNVDATARANHTGTQLAATISNFNTAVDARVATAIIAEGFGELAYQNKATADITGGTVITDEEGLGIKSQGTDNLFFKVNEPLNAGNRQLIFTVYDANRSFALQGNLVVLSDSQISGDNLGDETASSIGAMISAADAKTVPVDADLLGLADSTDGFILTKLSWANLKKGVLGSDVVTESNASTTMAVTRLGKTVRYTATGALDVTIPGTGTLGTNFVVELFNHGDSSLTIIADVGVTLIGNTTLPINKICTIKAITTNTYKIHGDI